MTNEDINNLDDVIRVLGIEDSHITPAEAVTMLLNQIDALQIALSDLLKTTPEERQDPAVPTSEDRCARPIANLNEKLDQLKKKTPD